MSGKKNKDYFDEILEEWGFPDTPATVEVTKDIEIEPKDFVHSTGNIYEIVGDDRLGGPNLYMLCQVSMSVSPDSDMFCLVGLWNGNRWSEPIRVKIGPINNKEFRRLWGKGEYTFKYVGRFEDSYIIKKEDRPYDKLYSKITYSGRSYTVLERKL